MARPRKDTEEARRKILEALRAGCTREAAAGAAGVHASSLTHWCERFSGFANECDIAEQVAEARFTVVVTNAAQAGNVDAALQWLKRRRRDKWGDNIAVAADRRAEALFAALFPEETGGTLAKNGSASAEDQQD